MYKCAVFAPWQNWVKGGWKRQQASSEKKYVAKFIQASRYSNEIIGAMYQYNKLMAQQVTSTEEAEAPNIRFDDLGHQWHNILKMSVN